MRGGALRRGVACADCARPVGAAPEARGGDTLVFSVIGRPRRAAFHFAYVDEVGFAWWCPVEYAEDGSPCVSVGRLEREYRV